jgi:hypothetical protein
MKMSMFRLCRRVDVQFNDVTTVHVHEFSRHFHKKITIAHLKVRIATYYPFIIDM